MRCRRRRRRRRRPCCRFSIGQIIWCCNREMRNQNGTDILFSFRFPFFSLWSGEMSNGSHQCCWFDRLCRHHWRLHSFPLYATFKWKEIALNINWLHKEWRLKDEVGRKRNSATSYLSSEKNYSQDGLYWRYSHTRMFWIFDDANNILHRPSIFRVSTQLSYFWCLFK